MRLWSPVRSDQFGGNARLKDGMWGEVSYNYWLITKGKNRTVGWVSPTGTQNAYFDGTTFGYRTNNMATNSLSNDFHGGTTLRFGNQMKHHGWELKTTIMQAQRESYEGRYGTMDILDDAQLYVAPSDATDSYYYANPGGGDKFTLFSGPQNMSSSFLWGWFLVGPEAVTPTGADDYYYALAPLPLTFDRYKIDTKVSHWDVEANYIFRAHATRVGFFEFTGGVRYMQLDDTMTFNGWGLPWKGTVLIELMDPTPAYTAGEGATEDEVDLTEYYIRESVLPGTNREYTYSGDITGPGTVLADSRWNFKAENHMVGPQVGIRYIKKCSGRWSIIADTKFFAAFNTQNLKSEGVFGSRTAGYDTSAISVSNNLGDVALDAGRLPWVPVGIMSSGKEFRHTRTEHEFSPVIDFGLKAKWEFTDAISLNIGYQGMWMDKTARSSLINSYHIDSNGNIFGINDKVTQSTYAHGVTIGATINR